MTQPTVPENNIARTRDKFARLDAALVGKNTPTALFPLRRLAEGAFNPIRILAKVAMGVRWLPGQ